MGLKNVHRIISEIKRIRFEADGILLEHIRRNNPKVSQYYEQWRKTYRLNTTAATAFISEQFCKLENAKFDVERRKRIYFAAATACLSDDLVDKAAINPRKVYFLDTRYHSANRLSEEQKLFHTFHSGLEKLLPEDFKLKFGGLIKRYNQAQERGQQLNGKLTDETLRKIKDGTGGYPSLLLHRITFPEREDPTLNGFAPAYTPKGREIPKTEEEAIFNYGAMLSRIDDLSDLKWDKIEGRKSLATENYVTWNSLKQDVDYVKNGLNRFYSEEIVSEVMDFYDPRTIRMVNFIGNLITRLSKKESK